MPGRAGGSRSSSAANSPTTDMIGDGTSASSGGKRSLTTSTPGSDPKKSKVETINSAAGSSASNDTIGGKSRGSPVDRDDSTNSPKSQPNPKEIVSQYVKLDPIKKVDKNYPPLSENELKVLEKYLDISSSDPWRDDWVGNLAFVDKDITSPESKSRDQGPRKTLLDWAANIKAKMSRKILNNLIRYVYNLKETPKEAKVVLRSIDTSDVVEVQKAIRRINYDPVILKADGWTTQKADKPVGASGGAYNIGDRVVWDGYEAVVIAFLHDDDLGDLWKAIWLDDSCISFDLEVEELEEGRKKYERRLKKQAGGAKKDKQQGSSQSDMSRRSARYASSADFSVQGIENGVVLAVSYSRGSRAGVFWPARVMHASEMGSYNSPSKRASAQMKVDLMFLAPYWNAPAIAGPALSYAESVKRHGASIFDSGPLLEHESIDASEECIQPYPYDANAGLDIDQLRVSFKFAGLPKAAFPRFVNAHRLALGLKTYAQNELKTTASELEKTTAGLFEAHPLSVQTAMFPPAVLHLPFSDILDQLPSPQEDAASFYGEDRSDSEPALSLSSILEAMKPPSCWGAIEGVRASTKSQRRPPPSRNKTQAFQSPPIPSTLTNSSEEGSPLNIDSFTGDLGSLRQVLSDPKKFSISSVLNAGLQMLLTLLPKNSELFKNSSTEFREARAREIVGCWTLVKVSL